MRIPLGRNITLFGLVLRLLRHSRVVGLLVILGNLLWRAEGQLSQAFTGDTILALLAFVVLHTRSGRGLLFLGWLFMLGIIGLNLAYIGVDWETLKALFLALAVGALWFVDWGRMLRRFQDR